MKEYIYYVKGMHCASCEILIEKKLLTAVADIKSVESSFNKGEVVIECQNKKPSIEALNKIFKDNHYIFSDCQTSEINEAREADIWEVIIIAGAFIVGFVILNKLGFVSLINLDSKSSLFAVFTFGILAGLSTCAALVGGIVLSMSKQWSELYDAGNTSFLTRIQPHLLFNAGRIISYGLFGVILGILGNKLQFSLKTGPIVIIVVSIIMILLALQMLGLKAFRKFQFSMPKLVTRYVARESNFKGRYMPFLLGAATVLLPCGFTLTAQGLALISGSAIKGGLIMLFFALGTAPMLLAIGVSSTQIAAKKHLSAKFLKVACVLVLFFAFFNINSQLNVLGISNFNEILTALVRTQNNNNSNDENNGFPPIVSGEQLIKMDASASGYNPNYFKVQVGVPVKWEVTDAGTSGCTNAIISKGLFSDAISLTPGQTSIKEFTPIKVGKYKFSCWMGMISGVIEVADKYSSAKNSVSAATIF